MTVIFFTNNGSDREFNEDAVLAGDVFGGFSMAEPMIAVSPGPIVAVADGIGGGPGGAQAARMVLDSLKELSSLVNGQPNPADLLTENLLGASTKLGYLSAGKPALLGLGSTVAGLWRQGNSATVFNCGDCRVYRSRLGQVDLLSRDHSPVYSLYLDGQISFEEIRNHSQRHVISCAVQGGSPERLAVFSRQVQVRLGDLFLVCSDGVWESLDDNGLEDCLSSGDPETAALNLAEVLMAKNAGDNFSFIVAQEELGA
ncbi:MAG: serine/threonine-protein phosphatase [Deltaproteobacteria bacterium]|nr:serine/threonine-protein phosphatase [Deltaproteobacteria bacterium]